MFVFSGETIIAIAGALGSGVCVKLLDHYYQTKEEKKKDAKSDLVDARHELKDARQEADQWREKYFQLFKENAILSARCKILEDSVRSSDTELSRDDLAEGDE